MLNSSAIILTQQHLQKCSSAWIAVAFSLGKTCTELSHMTALKEKWLNLPVSTKFSPTAHAETTLVLLITLTEPKMGTP